MNTAEKLHSAIANLKKAKRAKAHPKMIARLDQQVKIAAMHSALKFKKYSHIIDIFDENDVKLKLEELRGGHFKSLRVKEKLKELEEWQIPT